MHDITQRAAEAAHVPSFDDVLARGQRRRRIRNGAVAGIAATAVVAIIGGVQLVDPGGGNIPQPAPSVPTPTPTPTDEEPTEATDASELDQLVDDPGALVVDAAVTGNAATAVLWQVTGRDQSGLAISGDGYATRHLQELPIPGEVVSAGDAFLVRDQTMSKAWVAGPDGSWTRVVVAGPEAPVTEGEVPLAMSSGLIAVDAATARAHPVNAPDMAWEIDFYGGRLTAVTTVIDGSGTEEVTYQWSDDGGASWQSAGFDRKAMSTEVVVPTAAGTPHVIALNRSGGVAPLDSVLTMPAEGGGFTETSYGGERATISGAWAVDGEIHFLGDLWGESAPRESGVYRWDDGSLDLVPSSAPEATDADRSVLVDVADTRGGPTVLIAVEDRLFRSTDGGATWEEIAGR